jgi:ABC-type sugar transport system permease subunit
MIFLFFMVWTVFIISSLFIIGLLLAFAIKKDKKLLRIAGLIFVGMITLPAIVILFKFLFLVAYSP